MGRGGYHANVSSVLTMLNNENKKINSLVDAGFVDPDLKDFHLKSGSPAADSASSLDTLKTSKTTDFFSRPYLRPSARAVKTTKNPALAGFFVRH